MSNNNIDFKNIFKPLSLDKLANQIRLVNQMNNFNTKSWQESKDIIFNDERTVLSSLAFVSIELEKIIEFWRKDKKAEFLEGYNHFINALKETKSSQIARFDKRTEKKSIQGACLLIASEAIEAIQAFYDDNKQDFKMEIADVIIRCLDISKELNFSDDLENIILNKIEKNRQRGLKHGNKKA